MDKQNQSAKPMLSIQDQLTWLKEKGVTFQLCSEENAAFYLQDKTYLFKIAAYRSLFQKRVGGKRDGQYVGLDFGYLQMLASLDRELRYTLLPMTLDIEHFARTKLIRMATLHESEDGYKLIADYMASLNHDNRRRRIGEINMLEPDAYCGDLVCKYSVDNMPVWVFLELVSFGSFINLYLFCANRWSDQQMVREHYMLRQVKAVRNATAHSSNIINGFCKNDSIVKADKFVMEALAKIGISKRVRASKMKNSRIQQVITLLYLYKIIVPEGSCRFEASNRIANLSKKMKKTTCDIPKNDAISSSLNF